MNFQWYLRATIEELVGEFGEVKIKLIEPDEGCSDCFYIDIDKKTADAILDHFPVLRKFVFSSFKFPASGVLK